MKSESSAWSWKANVPTLRRLSNGSEKWASTSSQLKSTSSRAKPCGRSEGRRKPLPITGLTASSPRPIPFTIDEDVGRKTINQTPYDQTRPRHPHQQRNHPRPATSARCNSKDSRLHFRRVGSRKKSRIAQLWRFRGKSPQGTGGAQSQRSRDRRPHPATGRGQIQARQ